MPPAQPGLAARHAVAMGGRGGRGPASRLPQPRWRSTAGAPAAAPPHCRLRPAHPPAYLTPLQAPASSEPPVTAAHAMASRGARTGGCAGASRGPVAHGQGRWRARGLWCPPLARLPVSERGPSRPLAGRGVAAPPGLPTTPHPPWPARRSTPPPRPPHLFPPDPGARPLPNDPERQGNVWHRVEQLQAQVAALEAHNRRLVEERARANVVRRWWWGGVWWGWGGWIGGKAGVVGGLGEVPHSASVTPEGDAPPPPTPTRRLPSHHLLPSHHCLPPNNPAKFS